MYFFKNLLTKVTFQLQLKLQSKLMKKKQNKKAKHSKVAIERNL